RDVDVNLTGSFRFHVYPPFRSTLYYPSYHDEVETETECTLRFVPDSSATIPGGAELVFVTGTCSGKITGDSAGPGSSWREMKWAGVVASNVRPCDPRPRGKSLVRGPSRERNSL